MNINKVAVFGAGVWGSVIARHLGENGHTVSLWEYHQSLIDQIKNSHTHPHIPGFRFGPEVTLTNNLEEAVDGADMLVFVISSKAVRNFCSRLDGLLKGRAIPVISASKGIEDGTFKTVCEVIEEELPYLKDKVMTFSGPSFALEVARGIPTKILMAGPDEQLVKDCADIFTRGPIVAVPYKDRRGAEYGGAIKNVVAIGCGIVYGLGDGANTRAALMTEAMQEMNALIVSQGGAPDSVYSLAGLGDAVLTGTSKISRNWRLGEKLGQGMDLEEAKRQVGTIAEGADSVSSVYHIAKKNNLDTPVIDAIWEILINGKPAQVLLDALGFPPGLV